MASAFTQVLNNPKQAPEWIVKGSTILLPKKVESWISKNYRPIACVPTILQFLTFIITDRPYEHMEIHAMMAIEQMGGKKESYGCKDQMMINNATLENCRKRKKNLSTAQNNYKKAFDSVPHS